MKDHGVADVILGIRIHRTPQGLALPQFYYIKNVLDKFKYMEFDIFKTPLDVSFALRKNEDFDCDDFGDDVYAIPKIFPVQSGKSGQFSNGYGFGRHGMEWRRPLSGYLCHRCNVPGHYIQHCPTNGDPNYDIKKVKLPTKSMWMATPSGSVGVSKSNVEGLSSSTSSSSIKSSFRDIPPQLHCPLCKGLMKDSVIASKCCFSSFCDKCIRNHIISNSVCVCGARNILADALLPNVTLRVTVNRILESSNSSSEHGVSALRVQNIVSAHSSPPKVPFPSEYAALKVEVLKTSGECPQPLDELQQKPAGEEAGKMKKRKKPCDVDAVDMQWGVAQDHVVSGNNMPTYHPYSTVMQYLSYGRNVLPQQHVQSRKAGLKRKCEMGVELSSVITC
ncbi:hypothetical protein CQW23_07737 [Capsicum baccatum]|uniref:CCHC-type domain-containing protein n=1 Tax=Capsicum baccatum TaxID=33114 RepID=A0A2G2X6Y2_CAPBA|nr:hypothetical protein CQW23_07737 [Capsicum baccatum]